MQVGLWSGFVTDTGKMQFRVPPKKIAKLKSNLDFIISSRTVTFRDLARVAGFIKSLFVAVRLNSRLTLLFKCALAGTVHFLFLFIYWRSCVFGFLILRPLTFMGLSQSSPRCSYFLRRQRLCFRRFPSWVQRSACQWNVYSVREAAEFHF